MYIYLSLNISLWGGRWETWRTGSCSRMFGGWGCSSFLGCWGRWGRGQRPHHLPRRPALPGKRQRIQRHRPLQREGCCVQGGNGWKLPALSFLHFLKIQARQESVHIIVIYSSSYYYYAGNPCREIGVYYRSCTGSVSMTGSTCSPPLAASFSIWKYQCISCQYCLRETSMHFINVHKPLSIDLILSDPSFPRLWWGS